MTDNSKFLACLVWISLTTLSSGSEEYKQELKERHSRRLAIAAQKGEQRRARLALRKGVETLQRVCPLSPPFQTISPYTPWGFPCSYPCAYPIERGYPMGYPIGRNSFYYSEPFRQCNSSFAKFLALRGAF